MPTEANKLLYFLSIYILLLRVYEIEGSRALIGFTRVIFMKPAGLQMG